MTRITNLFLCAVATALASVACFAIQPTNATPPATPSVEPSRPRLTVVISIDQFRGDYLSRFADLFLPAEADGKLGGFRYLMQEGAWFADARYEHYPLFTAPGHAVIMTGGHPYKTGIIGNDWWDTKERRYVYAVDDPSPTCKVVGAAPDSKAKPASPLHLRSTTVGDELKLATGGNAKAVSLAFKDRPAILMGGHSQDACIWFDAAGGRWISSTAYCPKGQLPKWVSDLNDEHLPDRTLGADWTATSSAETLAARTMPPSHVGDDLPKGFAPHFPHHVGKEPTPDNYHAFTFTPQANDFVFTTAERAIVAEQLGQREGVADILTFNLSTNDYVGHAFGPYSAEVLEITLAADRRLAEFLTFLNQKIPGGMNNVLVVLTADHGVSPIPEDVSAAMSLPAGRYRSHDVVEAIKAALTARFGAPKGNTWFSTVEGSPDSEDPRKSGAYIEGYVCLNPDAVEQLIRDRRVQSRRDVEEAACDAVNGARIPGVYGCYGKTQILEGRLADNDLNHHLAKAVHPQISPDLIVLQEPLYLQDPAPQQHPTTHGTPYVYDTHVPILMCCPPLIRAGTYYDPVAPSDIAPTISVLLGVEFPSACDGRPLGMVLWGNAIRP